MCARVHMCVHMRVRACIRDIQIFLENEIEHGSSL
jgi:hypothetical protein